MLVVAVIVASVVVVIVHEIERSFAKIGFRIAEDNFRLSCPRLSIHLLPRGKHLFDCIRVLISSMDVSFVDVLI